MNSLSTFKCVCPHSLNISPKLHRLRSFIVPAETDVEAAPLRGGSDVETPYLPPEITTLYSVSARVEPLFLDANKRCVCVRAYVASVEMHGCVQSQRSCELT